MNHWIINIALVSLALVLSQMVLFPRQKEHPQSVQFFQALQWENLREIRFTRQGFFINNDKEGYSLKDGERTIPLAISKVQEFLDNWLLLPDHHTEKLQESPAAYGFRDTPDLELVLAAQTVLLSIGDETIANQTYVRIKTEKQDLFITVPNLLKRGLVWKITEFFPHTFLPPQIEKIRLIRKPFYLSGSAPDISTIPELNTVSPHFTPFPFLAKVKALNASPLALSTAPADCQPFLILSGGEEILGCPDGFYASNQKIYFTGPMAKELVRGWDFLFLSPALSDHLPYEWNKITALRSPDRRRFDSSFSAFDTLVGRLARSSLQFSYLRSDAVGSELVLYFGDGSSQEIKGYSYLAEDTPMFGFVIFDRILASFPIAFLQ